MNLPLFLALAALAVANGAASAAQNTYSPQHDEVLRYFTSGQEPKVKDALWTSRDIFKVGLLNDGTSRDGYAGYVCEVLYEHGFKGKAIWVQAIDIAVLKRTGKWVKLGESHCK